MSNYGASDLVQSTHNLPHLNDRLETTSSNFDIGYDDTNLMKNEYFQSLIPLAVIIGNNFYRTNMCWLYTVIYTTYVVHAR